MTIDFSNLTKFNPEISELLISNFDETLKDLEEAIKQFDIPEATFPINIRFINLSKTQDIRIRDIRAKHLGKLIQSVGLIRQASDVRPKVTITNFECPGCGASIIVEQKTEKLKEPGICQCGRKGKFRLTDKKLVDVQRLIIEEAPDTLQGGEQAKRLSILVEGIDLLDPKLEKRRYPGNKINAIGILKEMPITHKSGGQSTTFELIMSINNIETIEEEFSEITISEEEVKEIENLASDPKIYEILTKCIAPSIYGHDNIKQAIILQLFGGVKKERIDGTRTRGDIHLFLIGDPGSGKSEILKYTSTLAPKSRYIAGKGASAAGLTASVVKDDFLRGWALEAGVLVLANKGLAVLDELDKMTREDQSAMHEAMEQQSITIAKANIHATLKSETSILAAANPKFGRFDPYSPIASQIELPPTLINRFDLIFPIRDIPNPTLDEKIAKHILELSKDIETKKSPINHQLIRKYIAFAKQNCFPKMTQGAIDEIKNFYVDLRSAAAADEAEIKSIPISARQLEALVRIAEASARIRLSEKVTKSDAKRAIALLKSCMEAVALDIETGKFDIDRITTGITATQRSRIGIIKKIIEALEERVGKNIPISDIITEAESEGIDKAKAEEIIDNLKKKGDIFEPKPGIIQKIG